jgi:hypothetical protein
MAVGVKEHAWAREGWQLGASKSPKREISGEWRRCTGQAKKEGVVGWIARED